MMPLPENYIQILRECSRDEAAFQRLAALIEPLFDMQSQLAAIVNSSGDGIVGRTLDDTITSWNAGAEAIYGYTADEVIGKSMRILAAPDRMDELVAHAEKVKRGEYIKRFETVRIRKDGTPVDLMLTISPIKDPNGAIIGISSITQDITEFKRVQDALLKSEARYRAIVTTMTEGVVLQARDGSIETCNAAAERILGLTVEQMTGLSSADPRWRAVHEDFSPFPGETHPAMIALQTGQSVANVVMGVHKPDGTLTWILINSQPLFHADQTQPYAAVTSFTDITHIRHMELALQESEARLRSIFETMADAVWLVELPSYQMTYLNPAGQRIFGQPIEEFYQSNDLRLKLIHPEDYERVNQAFIELLDSHTLDLEYRILLPDGAIRWVHSRSWLVNNPQGKPMLIEGITSDITERKLVQQQALQLEVERERVKLLNNFISNTSHELRTPLTMISLGVYLLSRLNDQEKREAKAEELENQIQYLGTLINQLQQTSKLERLAEIDAEPVILEGLAKQIVAAYVPPNPKIVVTSHLAADIPAILGKPTDIATALTHLLDNAVRFSHAEGEVIVRTFAENDEVILQVQDFGIGIAPQHLNSIFEHFFKVDQARTRMDGGAGMGLALVKRIMQLHQGYVNVQSKLNEGSTFSLHFPIPK